MLDLFANFSVPRDTRVKNGAQICASCIKCLTVIPHLCTLIAPLVLHPEFLLIMFKEYCSYSVAGLFLEPFQLPVLIKYSRECVGIPGIMLG